MQRLREMDDDDDGVGYIADTHLLGATGMHQQEMALLGLPQEGSRAGSFSSNVSDLEEPIYDRTTSRSRDYGLNGKLAFAISAAALGSAFQHGYNTGVVNAPQKLIEEWIRSTQTNRTGIVPEQSTITLIWSLAVAIYCVGGMIGAAASGILANRFGRKGGLLINNILVLIAVILEGSAKEAASYEMVIVGRFILGINSGINAGLTPLYLMEISPINLRGAVGTVYQLVITISILVSQILGLEGMLGTDKLWPVLLSITIVPAIFQVATLPLCPESPKFLLLSRGQELEAQRALTWLRGSVEVHDEMEEMRSEYEAMKLVPKVTLKDLITNDVLRIPLIIAVVMMLGQQLSGINAVVFFSTKIFKMANLSDENAQYATLGMGSINVIMTVISLILVEKAGRKTLLLVGYTGMLIDTILLTFALVFVEKMLWISYVSIILVLLYIVFFATGPGSIPWFLVSEMFSSSARPTAQSVAVTVNWTANFFVGLGFLPIQDTIGPYVFIIFVVCLALTVAFIIKKVPETKNKTVEEITSMFRQQSYR